LALSIALTCLPVLAIFWGQFRYSSICPICGREQSSVEWQIPFTEIAYWHSHTISDTPLTATLVRAGAAGPHAHDWHFCHGGGNGVMCAIGDGRYLLPRVADPSLLESVQTTLQFETPRRQAELLTVLCDCRRANLIWTAASVADFPPGQFSDLQAFARWRGTHASQWDEAWETIDSNP
jgi:hypothetical protein